MVLQRLESDSLGKFGFYFFPPVAALVLLGILSFLSLQNIRRSEQSTAQLHEVVAIVKDLLRNLLNAESGQRGYLLTKQPIHLEPYHAGVGAIQADLERLRNATVGLVPQVATDDLEILVNERLGLLDKRIQLQMHGKSEEALNFDGDGKNLGKETMDKIRGSTAHIERNVRTMISDRTAESWTAYFNAIAMSAIAIILALAATIWSLLRVDRELQKRQLGDNLIRQRAIQLQSLADVVARIVAAKDVDFVIGIAVNEFRQLIGAREALIQLRSEGQSRIERGIIASGILRPSAEYLSSTFELVRLASEGEAVFFRHRSQLLANPSVTGAQAWTICGDAMDGVLTAPIRDGRSDEIGRIVLMGKFDGEFNENDLIIATQIAFNLSVAIENARLTLLTTREGERKDEFLAMLGHELRNPLASILTGSEALLASNNLTKSQPLFEAIHRQSLLMSKIVGDLLDVSRIGQGKIVLAKTHFDLIEVVVDLVSDFRRLSPERVLQLVLPQPSCPIIVHGDRTRVVQSITNLLHNAGKFSEVDQAIELSISNHTEKSNRARISITDHGVGLTSQEIDEIFQMFHQSKASIHRAQGGLGIGLTLAKGLMEMHGGTITANSPGPGLGSTFTMILPIANGESKKVIAPTDSISSRIIARATKDFSGSCRILVIDDRLDAILPIRILLTQDGHQIEEAHDGIEGLEKARQFAPDMIFCDIGLPGKLNGFDVAKAIRQDSKLRTTYLVALSGYSQPQDQQRSVEAGFDFHVAKPIEHRVLKQLIRFRPKF